MIAPIRDYDSKSTAARRRLSRARRAAASSLFNVEPEQQHVAPITAWKAWLISAWMVVVVVCYALHMARWW